MRKELELKLLKKISVLEREVKKIKEKNKKPTKEKKAIYQYSRIKYSDLTHIVNISQKIDPTKFNAWFINDIEITEKEDLFLLRLLEKEGNYLTIYSEETLKMKFLSPLLRKVDFKINQFQDFYNEKMAYETEHFILRGEVDFVVAKGLRKAKHPYFFIQEFKQDESNRHPRPQLLAELISAIELNHWRKIKGAYFVGSIWSFVILEKQQKYKYRYFISKHFDSAKIDDLKNIYRNLLFIKNEIMQVE